MLYQKHISFSIELNKVVTIDHGNPLVFIDSLHFVNGSLDNLVSNVWRNDYYHVSQKFN